MNPGNINKEDFLPLLEQKFSKELSREIIQFPIIEFPAKLKLGRENDKVKFFPIVIKGSIRVVKFDASNNEILLYNITKLESCILSITAAMRDSLMPGIAFTNEPSAIFAVSGEKADEWMEKYDCWRNFVVDLYDQRLGELITQHDIVSKQKDEISIQKKEITDSITYAQRIQNALLPPHEYIDSILPEYFILYKPKDIVSGDYYWLSRSDNKTIVAVADCTGHGVPGALMSMLGISALNQIIKSNNDFHASDILNELREQIKISLRQSSQNSETKDGMDIALMILDFSNNVLEYAGAYNPVYIIRKGELIEKQPDKMPIAIHPLMNDFTNHQLEISKGDSIYLFSDGFADQFGGPKSKKFMYKQFKELLIKISEKPMNEQKRKLENTFEQWKGQNIQTDDITVLGLKI